jgi:hypothetical protein
MMEAQVQQLGELLRLAAQTGQVVDGERADLGLHPRLRRRNGPLRRRLG